MRIGIGYDIHPLVTGRLLVIGGVTIPFDRGLAGHSDADVLSHAIADAILGALGQGDLGHHFPDTDPRYRGISSLRILEHIAALAERAGEELVNIDTVVIAEAPRLSPHLAAMRTALAKVLGLADDRINVKAKTHEGVGALGRGEGIAAQAICLIQRRSR